MTRLIVCRMTNASGEVEGAAQVKLEEISRACQAFIGYARNAGWTVGHIFSNISGAKDDPLVSCKPHVDEPVYVAKLASLFSHYPLEVFCSEENFEPIYLIGILDGKILQASLQEAQLIGVNLAISPNSSIIYGDPSRNIGSRSRKPSRHAPLTSSFKDECTPQKDASQRAISSADRLSLYNASLRHADTCIAGLHTAAAAGKKFPLLTDKENQEFHTALKIAEVELLRWKFCVGMRLNIIDRPEYD